MLTYCIIDISVSLGEQRGGCSVSTVCGHGRKCEMCRLSNICELWIQSRKVFTSEVCDVLVTGSYALRISHTTPVMLTSSPAFSS